MSITFRGLVKVVLISCVAEDGCKMAKFILKYGTETQTKGLLSL